MKLFGSYTSPFVRHCRVALAQGGYEFEFVETDYDMSAAMSPTSKVPFLTDGDLTLTDSGSILKYLRERSGGSFLADLGDYELFAITNTVLDATINLFLLENNGLTPEQVPYLQRQLDRVHSGLEELDRRVEPSLGISSDSQLRCACFVDWAIFRNRVDFAPHSRLLELLESANHEQAFITTAPPK